MNYQEFIESLSLNHPPADISPVLQALWYDGKGDWKNSHNIAQDIYDKNGSWIHAYLHRKEGDQFNAGYWYNKAGKPIATVSLQQEWEALVKHFI